MGTPAMVFFINLLGRLSMARSSVGAGTKLHWVWGNLCNSPLQLTLGLAFPLRLCPLSLWLTTLETHSQEPLTLRIRGVQV